ncbi:M23 family metallopeptidase [Streptomyces spiramenti]|uniref:Peptidoglycan DD-metalloendopeptidase family protein n=1 Tax=Streptomyces spiramenti TaxID=2720606 RepID=A0ABX1AW39_9ACTN|nr:M23 family metallopeptidase [Streptomyces spiramenti]NJP69048.1 peptidoglycan DD-metalloendopeptidase family protein [Streptomyces spiramenti]
MPGRGRHRHQRPSRLARISLALTAGSAGVALPLIGAGSASAAPVETAAPAAFSAQVAERAATAAETAADAAEEVADYTVVTGDTLSRIADAHDVDGGWLTVYDANRDVIGDNPNLIFPGQELALDGEAAEAAPEADVEQRADRSAERAAPVEEEPVAEAAPVEEAPVEEAPVEEAPAPATGASAPVDAAPSTPYRASGAMWGSGYHTGVDFSASSGTTVKSIAPGTVVSAGWGGAYGNEVVIRHEDGRYSQYAHLSSLSVSNGQTVGAGEQIGNVGSTGNSTGPHLHFEVRTGPSYGSDIDPLGYLRGLGVAI